MAENQQASSTGKKYMKNKRNKKSKNKTTPRSGVAQNDGSILFTPRGKSNLSDMLSKPLLLRNFHKLIEHSNDHVPLPFGHEPLMRPTKEYIKYGVINVKKSKSNLTPRGVATKIKNILDVQKTSYIDTLDPEVTGCLIVCLNRATRIVQFQEEIREEYVFSLALNSPIEDITTVQNALVKLRGHQFQSHPISAVNRQLRVVFVYNNKLLVLNNQTNIGVFWISCVAGLDIRHMCSHLGLLLGVGGHMKSLRRIRSGTETEKNGMVTMEMIINSKGLYERTGDDMYLRKFIKPVESLLIGHKRIIIKDGAINEICNGANVHLSKILRFEDDIGIDQEIVIVSTKGEAVALATTLASTGMLMTTKYNIIVAKLKRVIMDRDTYPYRKQWLSGLKTSKKKSRVAQEKLDRLNNPVSSENYKMDAQTKSGGSYSEQPNNEGSAGTVNIDVSNNSMAKRKKKKKRSTVNKSSSVAIPGEASKGKTKTKNHHHASRQEKKKKKKHNKPRH